MFGKFMNKKFFHPGSYPNIKMRWIHEQRDASKKKAEEEKQSTYQKEQESYQSRMLSAKSSEEKMKLDLNFLYDLPPGMKTEKDKEKEEGEEEEEVKFEWQKNAPRSKYINDLGLECQDQPFGVCVRNIRCFKCRAWGHQNTDRECPLFFSNMNSEAEGNSQSKGTLRLSDPLLLVGAMKEQHGISLKKSVIGQEIDPMADHQQFIPSDDDEQELGKDDLKFVQSLTDKQKRKLLKRLNKMEKGKEKEKKKKKKEKKKRKKRKDFSSSEDEDQNHKKKISESKSNKKQVKHKQKDNSSSSEEDDPSTRKRKKQNKSSSSGDEKYNRGSIKSTVVNKKDYRSYNEKQSNYLKRHYSSSAVDEEDNKDNKTHKQKHRTKEITKQNHYNYMNDTDDNYNKQKLSSNDRNKARNKHYDNDRDRYEHNSVPERRYSVNYDKRSDCLGKYEISRTKSDSYDEVDEQLHLIRSGLHRKEDRR